MSMEQNVSSRPDTGATIYARLMDARLEHPLEETQRFVDAFVLPGRDLLCKRLEEQLVAAYVAGVADGFAQGVAKAEA